MLQPKGAGMSGGLEAKDPVLYRMALLLLCTMEAFSSATQTITAALSGSWASTTTAELIVILGWFVVCLSPSAILVFARRSKGVLTFMALPIIPIFFGRLYYGFRFLASGYIEPKGDWPGWLNSLLGLVSIIVVVVWISARPILLLVDLASRWSGGNLKGDQI